MQRTRRLAPLTGLPSSAQTASACAKDDFSDDEFDDVPAPPPKRARTKARKSRVESRNEEYRPPARLSVNDSPAVLTRAQRRGWGVTSRG